MHTIVFLLKLATVLTAAGALSFGDVRFENKGKRFVVRGSRHHLTLLPGGTTELRVGKALISTTLPGANRAIVAEGIEQASGTTNYLVGDQVQMNVPTYSRIRYRSVYPGVDLIYYGTEGELEYDFVVAPGADPQAIQLDIRGAQKLRIDHGDLILETPTGPIRWRKPVLYQTSQDYSNRHQARQQVDGRFRLKGSRVSFEVGRYDRTRFLVIDPALNYLSYAGGSGNEAARGIVVDTQGNTYVAGNTTSENLPGTGGTLQPTYGGGIASHQSTGDAFVAKYTASGALAYMTYIGGNADDVAIGLAVDTQGSAYVTGYTNSTNFRTTTGVVQPTFAGQGRGSLYHEGGDAFVVKLNPLGNQLTYSTFFGGSRDDRGVGIAVDTLGNAYVTGNTISSNFPVTPGAFQSTYGGGVVTDIYEGGDGFVVKLNPTASQALFSTYLGGRGADTAGSVAVDPTGVYVGGKTTSPNFPTTGGAFQRTYGGGADNTAQPIFKFGDGFLAKLNPSGASLIYSTYLGGNRDDAVSSIALDPTGAVYATGATSSTNFPVTAGAAKTTYGGPSTPVSYLLWGDGFVAKLTPSGSALSYSTYFGGASDDLGWDVKIDASGNAYVAGQTNSPDFPLSGDALQKTFGGRGGQSQAVGDGVLLKLNPSGSQFVYASFLGGNGDDGIAGIAIDAAGDVYVTGSTTSTNFAVTANAAQRSYGGRNSVGLVAGDAFMAKFTNIGPVIVPDPAVKLNAVANAASYGSGTVAPGEIVILYGEKVGPAALQTAVLTPAGALDTTVAQTRVLFDGVAAPIVYVSAGQSAAIVPYIVGGRADTQVQIEYQGVKSLPLTVRVANSAPGLFSANSSGLGPGAIFNEDSTLNTATNPAAAGQIIVAYGTGEGQTSPPGTDGLLATAVYPKPALLFSATVGGAPAEILYFGAVPFQTAGLFQVNLRVPAGLSAGDQELIVKIGTNESQKKLTVSLK